jgi:hypothetical protein
MTRLFYSEHLRLAGISAALSALALGFVLVPGAVSVEQRSAASLPQQIKAFQPGESLSYDISWSKTLRAGTASMEVQGERLPDGREVLRLVVTSHTAGIVDKLYQLGDTVQSVFDPEIMQSLSFSLTEIHGKKTRRLDVAFDHERRTAAIRLNNDPEKTVAIPDRVQDSVSSLYYLRTREDFIVGRPIAFEAFNNDRSWAIEFQTLGRERVKTPAGEFATIKVRAYRGIFMSEGEVFVWLTDDVRKIPVLIKSKIKIGSLVFTLTSLKPGADP